MLLLTKKVTNYLNSDDSLEIIKDSGEKIIVECQQHIGENSVRAIAMDSTDGLKEEWKLLRLEILF